MAVWEELRVTIFVVYTYTEVDYLELLKTPIEPSSTQALRSSLVSIATPTHPHTTLTGHHWDSPPPCIWHPSGYSPQPQASHECRGVWAKMDQNDLSVSYSVTTPPLFTPSTLHTGVSTSSLLIRCHILKIWRECWQQGLWWQWPPAQTQSKSSNTSFTVKT